MKLQCSCGAKYAFDITPDMAQNPVGFVCPQCGADSSDYVNELVRRELASQGIAVSAPPPAPVRVAAPAPAPAPVSAAPPAPAGSRLKISHEAKPEVAASQEGAPVSKLCSRHPGQPIAEKCAVCQKPICKRCMESFGYFCSPLCRNKADMQGMNVPVYAGQKFEVEAKFWRKTGLIFGGIVGLILAFIGLWIYYAWFLAVPHKYFAVRFENNPAYTGKAEIVGKDQIIFLHGGTLARYDMRKNKQIWSVELVTDKQIDDGVKQEMDDFNRANAASVGDEYHPQVRSAEEVRKGVKMDLEGALLLRVSGQNVWVGNGTNLTRYDWDTGKVSGQGALPEFGFDLVEGKGELLMLGDTSVTHISLTDGQTRVEKLHGLVGETIAKNDNTGGGGLPGLGSSDGKPLDPKKVAAQAQNLKTPARIALPAVVANAKHEQQIEEALKNDPETPKGKHHDHVKAGAESFQLVPAPEGYVQFSAILLEEKTIERTAMKEKPKKSALDGDVNAAHTGEIANEILNDMQRDLGGSTVTEDASRYQVTVHVTDEGTPDWSAEVVGSPSLYPLKTVNVVAGGHTVIVLDKSNKKLWETTLTYELEGGGMFGEMLRGGSRFGDGPCVEQGDTLYVYDQAVLSAFDLKTGNARWRVPSVGVMGLFFDDKGMIYVNTTSGSPDDIKYSRQIDINKQTDDILVKLDPKTGKTLWSMKPGGFISYLHGKYIYTIQENDPNPTDEPVLNDTFAGMQQPPYLRIARINPSNGHIMWEHYQDRAPFAVVFHDNIIQLVFKKEVQVLKYMSF
jgi:hypothetical protein